MSHLGNYIVSLIESERRAGRAFTHQQMAERLGIRPSMLSRWLHRAHPGVNRATLTKMTHRVSKDPEVRAGFLAAYLRDQLVDYGADLIRIETGGEGRIKEEPPCGHDIVMSAVREAALSPKDCAAIVSIIRGAVASPRLRRSLLDLAEIAKHDILK